MDRDAEILEKMTDALIDNIVDLGDERAVIVLLKNLSFSIKDIEQFIDAAIHSARIYWANSPKLEVA